MFRAEAPPKGPFVCLMDCMWGSLTFRNCLAELTAVGRELLRFGFLATGLVLRAVGPCIQERLAPGHLGPWRLDCKVDNLGWFNHRP